MNGKNQKKGTIGCQGRGIDKSIKYCYIISYD